MGYKESKGSGRKRGPHVHSLASSCGGCTSCRQLLLGAMDEQAPRLLLSTFFVGTFFAEFPDTKGRVNGGLQAVTCRPLARTARRIQAARAQSPAMVYDTPWSGLSGIPAPRRETHAEQHRDDRTQATTNRHNTFDAQQLIDRSRGHCRRAIEPRDTVVGGALVGHACGL